jgi:hypothetical protein
MPPYRCQRCGKPTRGALSCSNACRQALYRDRRDKKPHHHQRGDRSDRRRYGSRNTTDAPSIFEQNRVKY